MVCDYHIYGAVLNALYNLKSVVLRPHRRIHSGKRAVFEHSLICQCEMMWCSLSVDIRAKLLCSPNILNRILGADMLYAHRRAGMYGKCTVSCDHHILGSPRSTAIA